MRRSTLNQTVLTNNTLAYGSLTNHYDTVEKGLFYVNFTNDGLVINYTFHENHKEMIKTENDRLQSLGYTTNITGRKFHKIEISFK